MSDTATLAPGASQPLSNTPQFTVSELSGALKRTVEERFGYVRVRGEVSNYRGPHSSGHAYFSLKDEGGRLDAVAWRTALARMRIKPEEGMEVIATGKITTFPGKSAYQIVVEALEPAGIGALMAMLEERRRRFAAEGLFDAARKQLLPYLPHSIGVVTSPTGAVIRDILHRIAGRFPRRVLVWPVRVQGEGSAAEIARAIRGFNALATEGGLGAPHILIVARGGGSLEDLWGFNDELVVRAAAESLIPLISAVGHETDWTLLDHVADLRAPTPTGAAELCVPVRAELLVALDRLGARHGAGALRLIDRAREALRSASRAMPSGADLLAVPQQRLDRAAARLPSGLRLCADRRRLALSRLSGRLAAQSPQARLARDAQKLDSLEGRLRRALSVDEERRMGQLAAASARLAAALRGRIALAVGENRSGRERLSRLSGQLVAGAAAANERRGARVSALGRVLAGLSYRSVLRRGFALVRDEDGRPIRGSKDVAPGVVLAIEFADGTLGVQAGGADAPAKGRAPRPKRQLAQGSLF